MEETENTRKRKRQYSKELLEPPKGPGLCRSQKQCVTEKLTVINTALLAVVAWFSCLCPAGVRFLLEELEKNKITSGPPRIFRVEKSSGKDVTTAALHQLSVI